MFTTPETAARAGRRLSGMWDRARDMYSRAGLRPYTVTIIRARTLGGAARRGDGPTDIMAEWPVLPTPKLGDTNGIQEIVDADQLRELGTVTLSEISLTYTEDVLLGRGWNGTPVPAQERVYWEIAFIDLHLRPTQRRRFVVAGQPFPDVANASWVVTLERAPEDRARSLPR